jgi:hypothetical protein
MATTPKTGPIDSGTWSDTIAARVFDIATTEQRIHGLSVEQDLAHHYSFAEMVLLALRGHEPSAAEGKAFELALKFLLPLTIQHAPVHAACLSKMLGTPWPHVLCVGFSALSQHAHHLLKQHTGLLGWLSRPVHAFPVHFRTEDPTELARVEALYRNLVRIKFSPIIPWDAQPTLAAASLGILHQCGLTSFPQIHTALCLSRLPAVASEAVATKLADLATYPIDLPAFSYEE